MAARLREMTDALNIYLLLICWCHPIKQYTLLQSYDNADRKGSISSQTLAMLNLPGAKPSSFSWDLEMKVVIIGGTGLIGRKLATRLQSGGHQVVAASPSTESIALQAKASTRH